MVFRTSRLDEFIGGNFSERARQIVESAPRELIARAAAFLLLSDSKASFAIEGESPPKDRLARWGNAISKAGQAPLTEERLVQLQRELIGDDRFVKVGFRTEHISANPQDLPSLLEGLIDFDTVSEQYQFDPVLTAACLSFGFVYIHPFEDGNGRIHRFLMHHVLAERSYTPKEIMFPISSVILDDIARYKDVLETVSRPLLGLIDWVPTEKGNVRVIGATVDAYRYFDATSHCEFLFKCIQRAVDKDLPEELAFLGHRDEFHRRATQIVDMSERTLDLLLGFLRQSHGVLSKRARTGEFAALVSDEVQQIERLYRSIFMT
jgi:hypothetical protein